MGALIGQEGAPKSTSCPNGSAHRTGWGAKVDELSKWERSSDRNARQSRRAVQMGAFIGQERAPKSTSCPNGSAHRTGSGAKDELSKGALIGQKRVPESSSCPNGSVHRTGTHAKVVELSKWERSSDRNARQSRRAVQMGAFIGQARTPKSTSCPKPNQSTNQKKLPPWNRWKLLLFLFYAFLKNLSSLLLRASRLCGVVQPDRSGPFGIIRSSKWSSGKILMDKR